MDYLERQGIVYLTTDGKSEKPVITLHIADGEVRSAGYANSVLLPPMGFVVQNKFIFYRWNFVRIAFCRLYCNADVLNHGAVDIRYGLRRWDKHYFG